MAQTLPIPAGQPLDATRTAAGQVVTLACAEAVAVQAAASITLAALLWPLIPAAHAMADLADALDQWRPLCPLPEQEASAPAKVVVVTPGSGGAGRAATVPGGRRGRCARPPRSRWGWRRSSCSWTRPPAPPCWPPRIWCGCSAGSRGSSRS